MDLLESTISGIRNKNNYKKCYFQVSVHIINFIHLYNYHLGTSLNICCFNKSDENSTINFNSVLDLKNISFKI